MYIIYIYTIMYNLKICKNFQIIYIGGYGLIKRDRICLLSYFYLNTDLG